MGKISIAEVLRLRATSAVSRDKSVRRSAQDDDSVGVLTKNTLNKLALMRHGPGLFSVPVRQAQGRLWRDCSSFQSTLRTSPGFPVRCSRQVCVCGFLYGSRTR